jgi:hypothetical protein
MQNFSVLSANKVTDKGNERIRAILEEAKNTLVEGGFSAQRSLLEGVSPNCHTRG